MDGRAMGGYDCGRSERNDLLDFGTRDFCKMSGRLLEGWTVLLSSQAW